MKFTLLVNFLYFSAVALSSMDMYMDKGVLVACSNFELQTWNQSYDH